MENKAILQFADILEWEFFSRLKDETAPAGKEFSYIDLLDFIEIAFNKVGITKKDQLEYDKTKTNNCNNIFKVLSPEMRKIYDVLNETNDRKESD